MKSFDREFLRFVAAGAFNTIFGYGLYLAFKLAMDYRVAYTAAYVAGIFISYWVNTTFVFRTRWSWRALLAFPGVYLLQYLLGLTFIWLLVEQLGVAEAFAPLLVIPLTIPITFFASRFVIKGRQRGP